MHFWRFLERILEMCPRNRSRNVFLNHLRARAHGKVDKCFGYLASQQQQQKTKQTKNKTVFVPKYVPQRLHPSHKIKYTIIKYTIIKYTIIKYTIIKYTIIIKVILQNMEYQKGWRRPKAAANPFGSGGRRPPPPWFAL